jgi:hypothetical protein
VLRLVGVATSAALLVALTAGVARSADLAPQVDNLDIGSQLMLALFGETSDSRASFAAAHGDRTSESPLRELALVVPQAAIKLDPTSGVDFAQERLALRDLSASQGTALLDPALFEPETSTIHFSTPAFATDSGLAHVSAPYQPLPEPAISPAPGTLAFAPVQINASDFSPSTTQLGAVRFEEQAESASPETPEVTLRDALYGAGANFDVRAGKRSLNVNLSSEYEHVGRNDSQTFSVSPLDSSSSWHLPQLGAPLFVPNYADMSRLSLGAGVSVPVVRGLTLNLNYDAQHLYGGYGLPGLMNLDTVNNIYGGKLTFNIPRISSSLSIGAYQNRVQDTLLPLNGQTQTSEDVNFTVKF